jgi:hypothetical protein
MRGGKLEKTRFLHVHLCPTILDFRAYRSANEEVELFLGLGIGLKVVGFDVVCNGLVIGWSDSGTDTRKRSVR